MTRISVYVQDELIKRFFAQPRRDYLKHIQLEGFDFDEEDTFTYGTLNMEIYRSLEGVVINILDTSTGEET